MGFSWRDISIQRLEDYEVRKYAEISLEEQIQLKKQQYEAIRAARTDAMPVQGGAGNKREEMIINNIAIREELENNLKIVRHELSIIERGLNALTDTERKILSCFYVQRTKGVVVRLCDELYISKTELYRQRDAALKKFTKVCYGVCEI